MLPSVAAEDLSTLWVPLRSNAKTLVAGAAVGAVRRRLKMASILFDQVLLEGGQFVAQAGPRGSSAFMSPHPDVPGVRARFQTAAGRKAASDHGFVVSVGAETDPGVPAAQLTPFIQSETTIHWTATLEPFGRELPAACDWIDYASVQRNTDVSQLAARWSARDHGNGALRRELPVKFVRDLVIKNSNQDLSTAAHAGMAVMQDTLHRIVVASRFDDNTGWRGVGFVLPIVLPEVAGLDWDTLVDVRRHKSMRAFRQIMRDVEQQALADGATGDLKTAAHRAYESYLAEAAGKVDGLGSSLRRTATGLVIGGMTGAVAAGWTGPLGIAAGAAIGTAPGAIADVVITVKGRRRRGWLSVHNLLTTSG